MRHGNDARLVFAPEGKLLAISTGSDATAEHEQGIDALLAKLCQASVSEGTAVAQLKAGEAVQYPDLLESRRVTRACPELQFVHVKSEVPQAILGVSPIALHLHKHELEFSSYADETDVAGAWDSSCFAVRVRGERYVNALRDFHEAMLAGHVAFAGKFLDRNPRLAGVILADTRHLQPEDNEALRKAQAKRESELRLMARDDSQQLFNEMLERAGNTRSRHIGYLWAVWRDAQEKEVHYALNPGHGVKAQYYGPYTREQLLAWSEKQFSEPLAPQRVEQPA